MMSKAVGAGCWVNHLRAQIWQRLLKDAWRHGYGSSTTSAAPES